MAVERKVTREAPDASDSDGRVVMFRPRDPARGRKQGPTTPARGSGGSPQRWSEPWDDYVGDDGAEQPHRGLINIIGVVFTVLLISAGLWLAHSLVEMRKIQDCVLSGRTNCAPIEVPSRKP